MVHLAGTLPQKRYLSRLSGRCTLLALVIGLGPSFLPNTCGLKAATPPRGLYVYGWDLATTAAPPSVCTGSTCSSSDAQQLVNSLAVPGVDGLTLVTDWSLVEPRRGVFQWALPSLNPWSSASTYVRGDTVFFNSQYYLSLVNANYGNQPTNCVKACVYWRPIGSNPDLFDQWIAAAAGLGKKVNIAIRAGGGDTGFATPCWLFTGNMCGGSSPGSVGAAVPLVFDVSAHEGLGNCTRITIPAPWDNFQSEWDAMLGALATHLKATQVAGGTEYDAVSMLRLTGINRTTDEFRLPEEILPQPDSCQAPPNPPGQNAIQTWLMAQYSAKRLRTAFAGILDSFAAYFPDKFFNLAIIPRNTGGGATGTPQNPFPEIGPNGCIYDPPVAPTLVPATPVCLDVAGQNAALPDQNRALLKLAAKKLAGQLTIEFESIEDTTSPVNSYVVDKSQTLNTTAAFMTNDFLSPVNSGGSNGGAACTGGLKTPTACTSSDEYLQLLDNGIFLPTPTTTTFRSQFLEIFFPNVLNFPDAVWKAHAVLVDYAPPKVTIATAPVVNDAQSVETFQVSGKITDTLSGVNTGTANFSASSQTGGDVSGTVTLNHLQLLNDGQVQGGTYSFQVSLPRSATGLSKFTITVSAQDNATNVGLASANVIVAPLIISP